ncbi:MAG: hypothetical protein Tsb0015_15240 [Simkaniaceae bacterium]
MSHISVMQNEVLHFFEDSFLKTFFEGTVGAGGHAEKILQAHPEIETYIACDRDPAAMEIAEEKLKPWKEKILWMQGNFAKLDDFLKDNDIHRVDGFFLI